MYLENQFLWSPEIVSILVDKLRDPPSDDFRVVAVLPAHPNDGADVSRGAVSTLIHADDGNERFLACTLYARTGPLRDLVYVHSKIGIVDDRWLTIGSANLNERSMFNDSEVNVVTLDEELARRTRLRLWAGASRERGRRRRPDAASSTSSGARPPARSSGTSRRGGRSSIVSSRCRASHGAPAGSRAWSRPRVYDG